MSSPLASVLADLFLGHHKNMWLKNYQGSSVPFYRRYVDDTFRVFNTENEAKLFFDFRSSQHPNIKSFSIKKPTRFWHSLMCVLIITIHLVSTHQPIRKRPSLDCSLISSAVLPSLKPRPNALDFSLYIARQMSSIVECCREGVAKRSRLFTRLGTQHSTNVLFDE